MRLRPALLCLTLWLTTTAPYAQQAAYPPYSLFNTQIRFMHSAEVGRVFKLFINLPRGYAAEPERHYPSLYILDPAAHFGMVADMQRLFEDGRHIEPVITVGIGYESVVRDSLRKYRTLDMSPTATDERTGGGPAFLAFIETELIPFVEAEYRVDPGVRGYWGGSFGGLFGTYAMVARPALFNRIFVTSPAVSWDDHFVFGLEEELAARTRRLPTRLYMAAGGDENPEWMLQPMHEFAEQLRSRGYEGLEVEVDVVPGENHHTIAPIGITRGLMRMFPRAREEGE